MALSLPTDRAEEAESVHLEVIRSAIRDAVDEIGDQHAAGESSAEAAGRNAEDAVAQWAAEEVHHVTKVSAALRHWARGVLRAAFHSWLSRTDPRRERSEAPAARQAVNLLDGGGAAGATVGAMDGWMYDDEAVLERPSVAMMDGPGHYVRAGYLPEHAHLGGAQLRGRAVAALRGVHDGPLPLGRQHEGRLHTLVPPPSAFPANSGFSGLPGPAWGAPTWATQPEHGAPVQHMWGAPVAHHAMPAVAAGQPAAPVAMIVPTPAANAASTAADPPANGVTPLGNGWEERHSAEGRPYYAHAPTQTTRWKKPTTDELGEGQVPASAAPTSAAAPVINVVDPLAQLRAIREEKARLRMRADELRWQSEARRDVSLAQSVTAELAAAATARPLYGEGEDWLMHNGYGYELDQGSLGHGLAAGRHLSADAAAAGAGPSVTAAELREIRARSGVSATPLDASTGRAADDDDDDDDEEEEEGEGRGYWGGQTRLRWPSTAGADGMDYAPSSWNHVEQENIVPRRRSDAQRTATGTSATPTRTAAAKPHGDAGRSPLSPLDGSAAAATDGAEAGAGGGRPPRRVYSRQHDDLPAAVATSSSLPAECSTSDTSALRASVRQPARARSSSVAPLWSLSCDRFCATINRHPHRAQGIHSIQWTALLACTQQVDTATANLEKELQAQLDYAKAQVALLKQQLLLDE